ncbi:MAG TPA: YbaK/EbsC family protein [Pyrinomonadaceae bacterium]|nr:YbaK/EbsC family protein [Pyrinomonadaceae bacterium]
MKEAVIVSAVRTAVGKAPKGTRKNTRPDDLAAAIREAVNRAEGLDVNQIDDVVMGCAFPEAEQGMNVARTAMIAAGLPVEISLTGYLVGGTSPFGTKTKIPVYVEKTIFDLERIYINGGKRGFLVEIEPGTLREVLTASVVRVAIVSGD